MYLKSLSNLKEASDSLGMSSKSHVFFIKAHTLSLKMSLKSLKIVQNASHYWKKPSSFFKSFKKASSSLKMYLKPLAIFEIPHNN
jgi:hypothetical protein